jgi:hypothetical protein
MAVDDDGGREILRRVIQVGPSGGGGDHSVAGGSRGSGSGCLRSCTIHTYMYCTLSRKVSTVRSGFLGINEILVSGTGLKFVKKNMNMWQNLTVARRGSKESSKFGVSD